MRTHCTKLGFTLVEMLTVLFIVSILLGISLGAARYASERSRTERAKNDLMLISNALIQYNLVYGDYPKVSTNSAVALVEFTCDALDARDDDGTGKDQYCFASLLPPNFTGKDPWGNAYKYEVIKPDPDVDDDYTYTILSFGRDGEEGTEDDVTVP